MCISNFLHVLGAQGGFFLLSAFPAKFNFITKFRFQSLLRPRGRYASPRSESRIAIFGPPSEALMSHQIFLYKEAITRNRVNLDWKLREKGAIPYS